MIPLTLLIAVLPAPREPIVALDTMEPGQTDLSAAYSSTLMTSGVSNMSFLPAALDMGTARPWTLGAAHRAGPFALHATAAKTGVGWMLGASVGWSPKVSSFVVEAGYAGGRAKYDESQRVNWFMDLFVPVPRDGTLTHVPSVRVRVSPELSPGIEMPLALRLSRRWERHPDLEVAQEPELAAELSAGFVWDTESCLQVGVGAAVELSIERQMVLAQASLGCTLPIKRQRGGRP